MDDTNVHLYIYNGDQQFHINIENAIPYSKW